MSFDASFSDMQGSSPSASVATGTARLRDLAPNEKEKVNNLIRQFATLDRKYHEQARLMQTQRQTYEAQMHDLREARNQVTQAAELTQKKLESDAAVLFDELRSNLQQAHAQNRELRRRVRQLEHEIAET
ncbi:MAG: hypothetical protein MHM6MM_009168, partial [Cercozoa sp. M6MM]